MNRLLASALSLSLFAFSAFVAPGCASTTASESADDDEGSFEAALASRTDAQVRAELEEAAEGVRHLSESDYPFTFVSAKRAAGDPQNPNITLVRTKFASFVDGDPDADKPLADLHAMARSFSTWRGHTDCGEDGNYNCAETERVNDALKRNLRGIKVFYFGQNGGNGRVSGIGVSVLIVGRAPSGNYLGLRTIAIWT
jgi:hypothetical protein